MLEKFEPSTDVVTVHMVTGEQALMGRGIHELPKVSLRPAMPNPSTPQSALTAVSGVARPQGGRPTAVFYPLGYSTPYGPAREVRGDAKKEGDR
jgi:hypothetical protein